MHGAGPGVTALARNVVVKCQLKVLSRSGATEYLDRKQDLRGRGNMAAPTPFRAEIEDTLANHSHTRFGKVAAGMKRGLTAMPGS
jgi:hypothetical protein